MSLSRIEKEILMCHALGIDRSRLTSHPELFNETNETYKAYLKRRQNHEPLAYIIGYQPFLGLNFYVGRSVLIPRPETEELVEKAINIINSLCVTHYSLRILDIGAGSGAIAITIAKHFPNIKVAGIESSPEALTIAQKNADFHKVNNHCSFLLGNIFEPVKDKYDIIISNPPYIPSGDIPSLMPDVRDYEPNSALDGGIDGLDYIKQIIQNSPKYLNKNGYLLMEIGFNQSSKVLPFAKEYFNNVRIEKDLAGIERFVIANNSAKIGQ